MGLVTVFWPLTTTGAGRLVVQTGNARFVVYCKVTPVPLVDHVKMTLPPKGVTASWSSVTGSEMLKTVPLPVPVPVRAPELVVPYRVLADKTNPASGLA